MKCVSCGRDINKIGHDNISPFCGYPLCEVCGKDKEILEEVEELYNQEQCQFD